MKKNTITFNLNQEQLDLWHELTQKLEYLKKSPTSKKEVNYNLATEDNLAKGIFLIGLEMFVRTANLDLMVNKNSEGELLN
jgi:hypothetical protein